MINKCSLQGWLGDSVKDAGVKQVETIRKEGPLSKQTGQALSVSKPLSIPPSLHSPWPLCPL